MSMYSAWIWLYMAETCSWCFNYR